MKVFRLPVVLILSAALVAPPTTLAAPTRATSSPSLSTANYFLRAGDELDQALPELATYDLLVLPAEAQVVNPDFAERIREINPDIVILAYVPTVSWNSVWYDALHDALAENITEAMALRRDGVPVSIWPGTHALDLTGAWNDTLAAYVDQNIMATGYWDGVFYDEVSDDVWWDKDREEAWRDAYDRLFDTTRERIGNAIILTNGSSLARYESPDGRMFESFPTPWEYSGDWVLQTRDLMTTHVPGGNPSIVNLTTRDTGEFDERDLRLALAAALLTDAYLSVDFGATSHGQLWKHPTFDGDIGKPVGNARTEGAVWVRTFTNGIVFMNPTEHDVAVVSKNTTYVIPKHDAIIVDDTRTF